MCRGSCLTYAQADSVSPARSEAKESLKARSAKVSSDQIDKQTSTTMFTLLRNPAIAAALALSAAVAHAASFDPTTAFSLAGNPNGPWSYGYSQTLGGPFILHAGSGSTGGLDYWDTDISIGLPWV